MARPAPHRGGFTTRASCLFAAGLTAVACGIVLGEVNLLRAGVLAAVIPWIASWAVSRTRVRIGSQRAVTPATVVAGEPVTVTLTVTNGSSLRTATLMLEDRLPDSLSGNARFVLPPLRNRESRVVRYRVPHLARGRYRLGPLQVRLTDPFGLIEVTRAFAATSDVVATPVVEPLGAAALPRADDRGGSGSSHSVGSQGADDASTREYRIGDDLRKIHWRSTARTGALMVRQEERPWQGEAAVLLDLRASAHADVPAEHAGAADSRLDSSLEWAVSAAASIGADALRTGRRITVADDLRLRRPVRHDSRDGLLRHLAEVRPSPVRSLEPVLAQLRGGTELGSTIAVLGELDAEALSMLVGATPRGREHAPAALLLDTDSWTDPGEGTADSDAARAAGALFNAGWRVTVVRRGDSVAEAWHRALGRSAGVPV